MKFEQLLSLIKENYRDEYRDEYYKNVILKNPRMAEYYANFLFDKNKKLPVELVKSLVWDNYLYGLVKKYDEKNEKIPDNFFNVSNSMFLVRFIIEKIIQGKDVSDIVKKIAKDKKAHIYSYIFEILNNQNIRPDSDLKNNDVGMNVIGATLPDNMLDLMGQPIDRKKAATEIRNKWRHEIAQNMQKDQNGIVLMPDELNDLVGENDSWLVTSIAKDFGTHAIPVALFSKYDSSTLAYLAVRMMKENMPLPEELQQAILKNKENQNEFLWYLRGQAELSDHAFAKKVKENA